MEYRQIKVVKKAMEKYRVFRSVGALTFTLALYLSLPGQTFAACGAFNNVNPGPPKERSDWYLVFSDEFQGTTVDRNKWNLGYCGQKYWRDDVRRAFYADENVVVANGNCQIITKKETREDASYTTGGIETENKFTFQAGQYIEARVKVPFGEGLWSSFWLTCTPNCWPPEIDMMEIWDHEWPNLAYQTWHPPSDNEEQVMVWGDDPAWPWCFDQWSGRGWYDDYHVFAAYWGTDKVEFYIDGVKTLTATREVASVRNSKMMLVIHIEGDGGWAPPLSEKSDQYLPATYYIDWVRAWSHRGDETVKKVDPLTPNPGGDTDTQSPPKSTNFTGRYVAALSGIIPAGSIIRMYGIDGRLRHTFTKSSFEHGASRLPAGTYIYRLDIPEKPVKSGVLMAHCGQ